MDGYIEDRLSGRKIWWCPSGQGNLAYCPQPIDSDDYTYCCTYYWMGADLPSCCRFPFHTGVIIAFILSGIVLFAFFIFFTCWCCYCCPLAKHLQDDEEHNYVTLGH